MSEIPEKSFYKVNEVCQYTDTQPYVLRFWESEFPQLTPHKNKTGQRVYTRRDLDLILKIKKLLHDEEYTIAGARARLDEEDGGRSPVAFLPDGDPGPAARAQAQTAPPPSARKGSQTPAPAPAPQTPAPQTPAKATLFEAAEPPRGKVSHEPKRAPVVPQFVSAPETGFIPEPPSTDATYLREEVRAERERADALHTKLDQVRAELDAAGRAREEAQRALEHQRETIATLQRDLEGARTRAARQDAAEASEATRLQEDLQRLEAELADARAALETERETLVHERAAADALRGRLHAVEANVEAARQDAAQARSRLDAAEAEALLWRERAQRASRKVADVASTLREAASLTLR